MTSPILSDPGTLASNTGLADTAAFQSPRAAQRAEVIAFRADDMIVAEDALLPLSPVELTPGYKRAVLTELTRLRKSRIFMQSDRLCRFLSFAVKMTLNGNANALKEYTIGIEAYGRRPDFDPSRDSIVRTEARRLRTKLRKYYVDEGDQNAIMIEFRPGSYVPIFYATRKAERQSARWGRAALNAPEYAVSVSPFSNLSGDALGEACARGLTDEFMHRLTTTDGINVFTPAASPALSCGDSASHKEGRVLISEGSVRTEGQRIRVTSRLQDEAGHHIASWRFDAETSPDQLFCSLETIALQIAACIDAHRVGLAPSHS